MEQTTNHTHFRRRRIRRRARPATVLIGVGLCLLAGLFEEPKWMSPEARHLQTALVSTPFSRPYAPVSRKAKARRVIYPYSIVPGGVQNRADLLQEVALDPVVAAHFSDFNASGARMVELQEAQLVHLSYRRDDKVFWTRNRVRLTPGERLITDGRMFARARCGNRISLAPQEPVAAEEPLVAVFDEPIEPEEELAPVETIPEPDLELEFAPDPDRPLAILIKPPEIVSYRDWSKPHLTPTLPPVNPVSPGPDIPGIPEPNTLLLVISGLAALIVIKISFRR